MNSPSTARSSAKGPLNKSRVATTAASRDGMQERRRREGPLPFARSLTPQTAREAPSREGCGRIGRSLCRAPRLRSAPRTRSRAAWCGKGRRRLRSITWSGACAAAPASGPWANGSQPRYDLRRASRDQPNSASNAAHEGLIQRSLNQASISAHIFCAHPQPYCPSRSVGAADKPTLPSTASMVFFWES